MAANPPDISAILAALGRQTGTPTQGNQQNSQAPLPAGYPGLVSASTPSNPSAGLSLPQPTNSGSLDLSGVKPVNSGNVSLADAIAKARGIAAEKASTRDDPRLSGRPYSRRSRSRSRSPPRRENFRDNYNPYRDERRDDPRRGANGRERSFSPAGGADAAFSPGNRGQQNRDRSPLGRAGSAGAGSENSEIITVPSDHVGMIIGRAGENLRRVESETGARVQFITSHENAGPLRQCRVSGTPRQRADAKREIFRVSEENPNGPPGRGGGRQNSQQQQHQPSQQYHQQPPQQQQPRQQQQQYDSDDAPVLREGEKSLQIMVPDKTVGLIIGRGGETIRDLQDRSGCHVNIVGENKSVNGLRPVNLIGSPAAAAKAKDLILEIVESDTRSGPAGPQPTPPTRAPYDPYAAAAYDPYANSNQKINDEIVVPSEAVGMIIGKGGETIKDMQNASGCKINVSPPSGADINRQIGLIGTRIAIESAKRLIWDKVGSVREKQGSSRGPEPMPYGDPYAQQQPVHYGQPPPMSHTPSMPPSIPADQSDPYAPYGGYQNYVNMWYAAALAHQPGHTQPQ